MKGLQNTVKRMSSLPLFNMLPTNLEEMVLSFRMNQILLNKTKGEYCDYTKPKLKKLLRPTVQKQVIISQKAGARATIRIVDIGRTPWSKGDHIIIVPIHLEKHVQQNYPKIEI